MVCAVNSLLFFFFRIFLFLHLLNSVHLSPLLETPGFQQVYSVTVSGNQSVSNFQMKKADPFFHICPSVPASLALRNPY